MMIATSLDDLKDDSQAVIQNEAQTRIFEALGIADRIERITAEFAEQVLPFAGTMEDATKQARRWIVQSLVDQIAAQGDYEVMLLD